MTLDGKSRTLRLRGSSGPRTVLWTSRRLAAGIAHAAPALAGRRAGPARRGGAAAVRKALLIARPVGRGGGVAGAGGPAPDQPAGRLQRRQREGEDGLRARGQGDASAGARCAAGDGHRRSPRSCAAKPGPLVAARLRLVLREARRDGAGLFVRSIARRPQQGPGRLGLQGRPAGRHRRRRRHRRALRPRAACAPASASPGSTAACASGGCQRTLEVQGEARPGRARRDRARLRRPGQGRGRRGRDGHARDGVSRRDRRARRRAAGAAGRPLSRVSPRRPGWSARSRSASRCREADRRAARRGAPARRLRRRPGRRAGGRRAAFASRATSATRSSARRRRRRCARTRP